MLTYWGKMNLPAGAEIPSLKANPVQEIQEKSGATEQVRNRSEEFCSESILKASCNPLVEKNKKKMYMISFAFKYLEIDFTSLQVKWNCPIGWH